MLRSWKSRKQNSRRRSRSVRGGTYTKVRSCSNRRRNRFDYTLLHVSLIDDDILQAILRRDVHESALCTRFSAGASQSRSTIDQPFAICSLEEQKQGYPSPFHRCLIWLEPHPVRVSWQLPEWYTDFLKLGSVPYACIRQALWHHRPKWCRKVDASPTHCHARCPDSPTYHYPLRRTRGTISALPRSNNFLIL